MPANLDLLAELSQIVGGVGAGAAAFFAWKTVGSWLRERRLSAVARMHIAATRLPRVMKEARSRFRSELDRPNNMIEEFDQDPMWLVGVYAGRITRLNDVIYEFEEAEAMVRALFPNYDSVLSDGIRKRRDCLSTAARVWAEVRRTGDPERRALHDQKAMIDGVIFGDEDDDFGKSFLREVARVTTWTKARIAELQRC